MYRRGRRYGAEQLTARGVGGSRVLDGGASGSRKAVVDVSGWLVGRGRRHLACVSSGCHRSWTKTAQDMRAPTVSRHPGRQGRRK